MSTEQKERRLFLFASFFVLVLGIGFYEVIIETPLTNPQVSEIASDFLVVSGVLLGLSPRFPTHRDKIYSVVLTVASIILSLTTIVVADGNRGGIVFFFLLTIWAFLGSIFAYTVFLVMPSKTN